MSTIIGTEPILLVGGFGSNYPLYAALREHLAYVSGRSVAIAPITILEWAGVVVSDSYSNLLRILDQAVQTTLRRQRAQQLILVAHSAGGVLSRIYMGDQPYGPERQRYNGFKHVAALVTLGTPHATNQLGRQGGMNQIAFVQAHYPGAYWRFVHYVSIMGRSVLGDANGAGPERGAWSSYRMLTGDGDQWGDGIVPLQSGLLPGSRQVIIPGLRHDPRPDRPWYGTSVPVVKLWWDQVEVALQDTTPGSRR
ncbi:MAG: lipase [Candidatus Viridilinea halotolerans]|uniref:Lipase n=1 Tax=Candidatus Viridilinea halotolerans TaxID=2491704 RepID=A0A426U006_9CHLR|nr:MAG: lipase [Candidatus Viridilinea halotolerans]